MQSIMLLSVVSFVTTAVAAIDSQDVLSKERSVTNRACRMMTTAFSLKMPSRKKM